MISKKFLQSNLTTNSNKMLKRILTHKLIKISSGKFATLMNINFSHMPNSLPLEIIKINKQRNNNFSTNVTLNELLLSKLSK